MYRSHPPLFPHRAPPCVVAGWYHRSNKETRAQRETAPEGGRCVCSMVAGAIPFVTGDRQRVKGTKTGPRAPYDHGPGAAVNRQELRSARHCLRSRPPGQQGTERPASYWRDAGHRRYRDAHFPTHAAAPGIMAGCGRGCNRERARTSPRCTGSHSRDNCRRRKCTGRAEERCAERPAHPEAAGARGRRPRHRSPSPTPRHRPAQQSGCQQGSRRGVHHFHPFRRRGCLLLMAAHFRS